MKTWLASLRIYREPRLIGSSSWGFSGLPLGLTATLTFWLAERACPDAIGLFARSLLLHYNSLVPSSTAFPSLS